MIKIADTLEQTVPYLTKQKDTSSPKRICEVCNRVLRLAIELLVERFLPDLKNVLKDLAKGNYAYGISSIEERSNKCPPLDTLNGAKMISYLKSISVIGSKVDEDQTPDDLEVLVLIGLVIKVNELLMVFWAYQLSSKSSSSLEIPVKRKTSRQLSPRKESFHPDDDPRNIYSALPPDTLSHSSDAILETRTDSLLEHTDSIRNNRAGSKLGNRTTPIGMDIEVNYSKETNQPYTSLPPMSDCILNNNYAGLPPPKEEEPQSFKSAFPPKTQPFRTKLSPRDTQQEIINDENYSSLPTDNNFGIPQAQNVNTYAKRPVPPVPSVKIDPPQSKYSRPVPPVPPVPESDLPPDPSVYRQELITPKRSIPILRQPKTLPKLPPKGAIRRQIYHQSKTSATKFDHKPVT